MSGTNPGAWPDKPPKWAEDLEEMPERLFTTADLKAARLETVERCLYLLDLYISNVGPLAAKKVIEMFKEEIENE